MFLYSLILQDRLAMNDFLHLYDWFHFLISRSLWPFKLQFKCSECLWLILSLACRCMRRPAHYQHCQIHIHTIIHSSFFVFTLMIWKAVGLDRAHITSSLFWFIFSDLIRYLIHVTYSWLNAIQVHGGRTKERSESCSAKCVNWKVKIINICWRDAADIWQ